MYIVPARTVASIPADQQIAMEPYKRGGRLVDQKGRDVDGRIKVASRTVADMVLKKPDRIVSKIMHLGLLVDLICIPIGWVQYYCL